MKAADLAFDIVIGSADSCIRVMRTLQNTASIVDLLFHQCEGDR